MPNINIVETASDLLVAFPFELREAFREIFKTAPWDAGRRVYVVKKTTTNQNKLAQFKAAAEPLLADLAALESSEASPRELDRMREQVEACRRQLEERLSRVQAARDELAELRATIAPLEAEAASALGELNALEQQRQLTLEPVIALCAEFGVPKALSSLRFFSSRSFLTATQKEEFEERRRTLCMANKGLAEKLAITLPVLEEFGSANYNRLDKVRGLFARYGDIYAGLKKNAD